MELKQITLKSWTQFLIENLPWSPLQGGHTPSLPHHLLPEVLHAWYQPVIYLSTTPLPALFHGLPAIHFF